MTTIQIYTDGSFNPDYKMYAGACIVVLDNETVGQWVFASRREDFLQSNNVAGEAVACVQGIRFALEMFPETTELDLIALLEHKLDKANRKVAFVQHKPVQQVLTKIKALSPQDRALLATYLTDEE